MKSSNEPRLQLLILSKDLAHMQRIEGDVARPWSSRYQ
jgi:hypothetical protein